MNVAVGTRWTSLNISETPDLLDFLVDFTENGPKKKISSLLGKNVLLMPEVRG